MYGTAAYIALWVAAAAIERAVFGRAWLRPDTARAGVGGMDDAALIKLSHLLATMRSVEVIANNIANASTPGYKRESVKFEELLSKPSPSEDGPKPDPVSFVQDAGVVRDLTQGRIDRTDAPYDLAIEGHGYFVLQTPAGQRFTRNGHFALDGQGRLVSEGGSPVVAEGGEILVFPEDGTVHVAADGTVSGRKGPLGKIKLVGFPDERALTKEGNSCYATDQPPTTAAGRIVQGAIETSIVEPVMRPLQAS